MRRYNEPEDSFPVASPQHCVDGFLVLLPVQERAAPVIAAAKIAYARYSIPVQADGDAYEFDQVLRGMEGDSSLDGIPGTVYGHHEVAIERGLVAEC